MFIYRLAVLMSVAPDPVAGKRLVAHYLRSDPVVFLDRQLGADPNSKLECFRGSVLALTVKTVGIGAKLTIKENDWVGPKVVPYEPLSRDRVGRHVRQNDDPAPPPLSDDKSPVQERNGG